jgi:hypothetical protein
LGKIIVNQDITVKNFKQEVYNQLVLPVADTLKEEVLSIEDIRLRNPKNDDLGEVMSYTDDDLLEKYFLYDGKEFLVQKVHSSMSRDQVDVYNILVKEWNPATWEFGTLHEVAIDKMLSCEKLVELLQSSLFPHIPEKQLFATKVNICKPFIRSDLVLRSW